VTYKIDVFAPFSGGAEPDNAQLITEMKDFNYLSNLGIYFTFFI